MNDVEQKKRLSISTPAAILTAGALIAFILFLTRNEGRTTPLAVPPSQEVSTEFAMPKEKISLRPTDAIRGDANTAEVLIVEYSDSDCPFCARFHETMELLIALPSVRVAWAYRHFPLSIHPNAQTEAIALECVKTLGGTPAFWSYLDTIIDTTFSPEKSTAILATLAQDQGVSKAAFTQCLTSNPPKELVAKDAAEAQSLGARGTPFSIAISTRTGEQIIIPGALPFEQMKELVERLK